MPSTLATIAIAWPERTCRTASSFNSRVYCARTCFCVISQLLVGIFNKAKNSTFQGQVQSQAGECARQRSHLLSAGAPVLRHRMAGPKNLAQEEAAKSVSLRFAPGNLRCSCKGRCGRTLYVQTDAAS